MSLFPLEPRHAAQIAALADSLYPSGFPLSPLDIAENLARLTPEESYCWGIEAQGELVAFLMAWRDTSQIEGREDEAIVLVDDLCVTPRHRRHVYTLLRQLELTLRQRGVHGIPLEGTHREEADRLFTEHARVVARLGYRRVAQSSFDSEHGERLVWTRYEGEEPSREEREPAPMQVTCRLCRFRFELTDPTLTETRCPRCEGKVKLDPAQTQEVSQASQVPLGCPGCLNLLSPSDRFPVTCRYCGTKIEQEQGEKLGAAFKGLEPRIKQFLLAGGPPGEATAQIQQLGVEPEKAFGYVDKLVLEVPFERHPIWKEGGAVVASSTCDSCGVAGQLAPYAATWNVRDEELKRYRPGWGGFTKDELKSRKALYFLCKDCSKLPPERFAGGYPARNGFLFSRLEPVKQSFSQPGPSEPLSLGQPDHQG